LKEISRNINISKLGEEGKRVGEIVTSTGGKARAAAEAGLGNPGLDTHPLLEAAGTVSPHAALPVMSLILVSTPLQTRLF
jgi:hypothetical protein